jgi:hypothetical protein
MKVGFDGVRVLCVNAKHILLWVSCCRGHRTAIKCRGYMEVYTCDLTSARFIRLKVVVSVEISNIKFRQSAKLSVELI